MGSPWVGDSTAHFTFRMPKTIELACTVKESHMAFMFNSIPMHTDTCVLLSPAPPGEHSGILASQQPSGMYEREYFAKTTTGRARIQT